ncbi:MAG: hypothetical protein LBK97_05080 [Prevotellaceae bacterium]|nr:hypothetical protein [Prevotellaceae bacterium]
MNSFDEILYRLVRDNRRVILPGIGAFITGASGEGTVFSPLLTHSDGFLEDEMQKEGIVSPRTFLEEFAENVTSVIEKKGQHYRIEGLGYFFNDGTIGFVFEKDDSCENSGDACTPAQRKRMWRIIGFTCLCLSVVGLQAFVIFKISGSESCFGMFSSKTGKTDRQFIIIDRSGDGSGTDDNDANSLQPSPHIKSYHVIAAFFEEKAAAENFVMQCRKMGYGKAEILFFTGILYPVSIGRFASPDEALVQKREYDSRFGENTLIFRTK